MNGNDVKRLLSRLDVSSISRFRAEAVAVAVLVALSLFFYRFGFQRNALELQRLSSEIEATRAEIAVMRSQAASAEGLKKSVDEAERGLAALERRLKGLKERLPSDAQVSRLLRELTDNGPGGLRITAIKPLPALQAGELSRLPFQITAESRFIAFGEYLERIERMERLMVVDNFMVEPKEEGSSMLVANIYLSAYTSAYGAR